MERIIHDQVEPCPYLPNQQARMPLRYRSLPLTPSEFDDRMAGGERRTGPFMYRPICPACNACEAIRLEVACFEPTRTQRRVWKRGQTEIISRLARPQFSSERLQLFNKHRNQRDLARNEADVDQQGYRMFLVESCCDTWEISYWIADELVGVAIFDRGVTSLSAVYCYFDPQETKRSLGVYSILKHLDICRQWNLKHLYLGYYVAGCSHMNYKQAYKPHERLINGEWQLMER